MLYFNTDVKYLYFNVPQIVELIVIPSICIFIPDVDGAYEGSEIEIDICHDPDTMIQLCKNSTFNTTNIKYKLQYNLGTFMLID